MSLTESFKFRRGKVSITGDDLRQSLVIAKNEMRKFLRGRKILLFILLAALFLVIDIALPAFYWEEFGTFLSTPEAIMSWHASNVSFIVLLGAVLFASFTIVSEFEERTYLLLFTRPVKKTAIFVGKFLACYVITLLVILAFYGVSAVHSLVLEGAVTSKTFASIGMSMAYIFALSGLAVFFSCISKKGSISALMTFFLVLMVPQIISVILMVVQPGGDYWYLLNIAGGSISSIFSSTVQISKALITLFLWGAVPLVLGWLIFLRREA
ncbi:MAG: ABC transporter permease [Candidatus Methanomethylophilaceae archaeon]